MDDFSEPKRVFEVVFCFVLFQVFFLCVVSGVFLCKVFCCFGGGGKAVGTWDLFLLTKWQD